MSEYLYGVHNYAGGTRLSSYYSFGRDGKAFPKHGGSKGSKAYAAWKQGRAERRAIVKAEFVEARQYWIELAPGWVMPSGEHAIVEDTRQEARSWLGAVERCECAECVELLAAVSR